MPSLNGNKSIPLLLGEENLFEWDQALKAHLRDQFLDHLIRYDVPPPDDPDISTFNMADEKSRQLYVKTAQMYSEWKDKSTFVCMIIRQTIAPEIALTLDADTPYRLYNSIVKCYPRFDRRICLQWAIVRRRPDKDKRKPDHVDSWPEEVEEMAQKLGVPVPRADHGSKVTFLSAIANGKMPCDYAQESLKMSSLHIFLGPTRLRAWLLSTEVNDGTRVMTT